MLKLVMLIVGLLVGFGGGVYWASHNPEAANKISAEEERRFLETQMQISQKIQEKLDQLSNKTSSRTPGASLVAPTPSAAVQPTVSDLKADNQKQQEQIRQRLNALK